MTIFKQPPILQNAQGKLRKVGFELEFAQVGIAETVQIIRELYGGELQIDTRFSQKVINTSLGDFQVEIDLQMLTGKKYRHLFDMFGLNLHAIKVGASTLEDKVEAMLEGLMTKFFPYEVATPAVPITRISEFEALREALFEHHAEGTEAFPTNAFGTHINIEVPDKNPETILRYIKAFMLLYPWLLETGETDFMRQNLTAFINPFPEEYNELVMDSTYHPDQQTLINDYHYFNPDRNRPLDLYPLFSAIAPEQISTYSDVGKVNPRMAFHYRLPNSCISKADWSLAKEWNNWVVIENLASAPEKLNQMSQAYQVMKDTTLLGFDDKWVKQTAQWLS